MKIEVSNGEIIDKLTIIEIKLERIKDTKKIQNLQKEYEILNKAISQIMEKDNPLYHQLYQINNQLWDIEDKCRYLEHAKDFGNKFIEITRSVYITNDKRSEIKKQINIETKSNLIEEKSHQKY